MLRYPNETVRAVRDFGRNVQSRCSVTNGMEETPLVFRNLAEPLGGLCIFSP